MRASTALAAFLALAAVSGALRFITVADSATPLLDIAFLASVALSVVAALSLAQRRLTSWAKRETDRAEQRRGEARRNAERRDDDDGLIC